ncbi:hypothetical protein U1Q18_040254 [Sarracenia purpurea var. burkii]
MRVVHCVLGFVLFSCFGAVCPCCALASDFGIGSWYQSWLAVAAGVAEFRVVAEVAIGLVEVVDFMAVAGMV